jgi:hypothetical protein
MPFLTTMGVGRSLGPTPCDRRCGGREAPGEREGEALALV